MQPMSFGLSRRSFLASSAALGFAGAARAADTIKPDAKAALIVTDVQNCFVDGGTLPVKGGADIVPIINKLAPAFLNIVITQDWHTPGHVSVRVGPSRQEAVRDDAALLRHPGAVARPLHPGLGGRGRAQGPQAAEGGTDHPQGLPHGHRQLLRLHGGRRQDPRPGWRATSRSAASTPCSSPDWPPTSAWPGAQSMRASSASRPMSSRMRRAP